MDFTKNIPKYKPKLFSLLLTLAIAVTTFIQNPLTVYADWASDFASAIIDSTGDDSSGGTDKVVNGPTVYRTGYLCYMLTVDGQTVPNTDALALKAPGYAGDIPGSGWLCTARKGGYKATGWSPMLAPWNLTPWQAPPKGSKTCTTNEPQIKAWMLEETSSGTCNAVNFVANIWGEDVAEGFSEDRYILVIETIMNMQFSVTNKSDSGSGMSEGAATAMASAMVYSYSDEVIVRKAEEFGYTGVYGAWNSAGSETAKTAIVAQIRERVVTAVARKLISKGASASGKYIQAGQPVIATVPNLINYKHSIPLEGKTAVDSYTNKVAPISERIIPGGPGERAGFKAWTGSTSTNISDGDILNYGLGMIVVTAKRDGIPTWDSITYPTGDVGPAPDHPKGKYNIVKNYYTKDGETGEFISDDGCFIREGVVPTIHVINEPQYQVVGYKTSTTTQSIPSNLWDSWSPPNPQKQKKSTGTVKLESPETCIYVLLERIENPPPEVIDYNYILKESQITRRVYFSFPEEDTAKYKDSPQSNMNSPYIYEHEFRWISPEVPICKGHPYMDDCPWHDPGCNENCLEDCDIDHSFQHDYDCVEATAYCKDPDWEEKSLLLSINNTLQEAYQNVLVPQATWNREVKLDKIIKRFYEDNGSIEIERREDKYSSGGGYAEEWHEKASETINWDYICVLMRGADKLTVAEWENAGDGNYPDGTAANKDLKKLSEAGFTVANQDSGTRKTKTYYEVFNAVTPGGVYFFCSFLGMSHVKLSKIFKVGSSCRKQGDCYFFIIL